MLFASSRSSLPAHFAMLTLRRHWSTMSSCHDHSTCTYFAGTSDMRADLTAKTGAVESPALRPLLQFRRDEPRVSRAELPPLLLCTHKQLPRHRAAHDGSLLIAFYITDTRKKRSRCCCCRCRCCCCWQDGQPDREQSECCWRWVMQPCDCPRGGHRMLTCMCAESVRALG